MLPFKAAQEAGRAVNNFRLLTNEWFEEKKAKIELDNKTALKPSSKADLMGTLITSNIIWLGNLLTGIQNQWLGVPVWTKAQLWKLHCSRNQRLLEMHMYKPTPSLTTFC